MYGEALEGRKGDGGKVREQEMMSCCMSWQGKKEEEAAAVAAAAAGEGGGEGKRSISPRKKLKKKIHTIIRMYT